MTRQIKEQTRKEAAAAFDAIRKLAADYERLAPGAGELLLRRVTNELERMRRDELRTLGTGTSQLSSVPGASAA